MLEWSNRYDHLREVTRDDVLTYIKTFHGHQPRDQLVALRPPFTWATRHGLASHNSTSRIRARQSEHGVLQPLLPEQAERSVTAATTPAARPDPTCAAAHAARAAQTATLALDDIALGNRRLTIAGHARSLDDFTRKPLTDRVGHRRRRWPSTANLHLLINNQTANTTSQAPATTGSARRCGDRTPPRSGSASTGNSNRPWSTAPAPAPPPCGSLQPRREDRDALGGLRTGPAGGVAEIRAKGTTR
ncbi:hypothetical protein [Streptomyces javensis]|uniref:Integrase n=2 Tax=Streptomyces javensis TaxID=114698 RepID=A0ABS0RK17_9ACTN|nr:hypothetical protein [Streptomyces javensis]MBI0317779.1 hypothetical protein [Streptomyces javensis]